MVGGVAAWPWPCHGRFTLAPTHLSPRPAWWGAGPLRVGAVPPLKYHFYILQNSSSPLHCTTWSQDIVLRWNAWTALTLAAHGSPALSCQGRCQGGYIPYVFSMCSL